MSKTKYVFVTGGVTSSLGKGIISASLANLLQARGYKVTIQKLDPYINIDPGTLNPYEHGECFVTDDGAETDLDLGHDERFLNVATSQANNVTTGRIYQSVISKERKGEYLGKTVYLSEDFKIISSIFEETIVHNSFVIQPQTTLDKVAQIETVKDRKKNSKIDSLLSNEFIDAVKMDMSNLIFSDH